MQRQNFNEEMQKAKEEGQVPRQEDLEKMHGNMQKMPNRYSNINCMWYREPLKVLRPGICGKYFLSFPQKTL